MIFAWLSKYALLGLGIALALALALVGVQTVRLAHEQSSFATYRAQVANNNTQAERQRADDERIARAIEQELRGAATRNAKDKDDAIKNNDVRVAALTERLRSERAARPVATSGPVAAVAGDGKGSTGAGLYREDGIFLAGEAASAARIGIERDSCYRDYDAAREALNKSTPGAAK